MSQIVFIISFNCVFTDFIKEFIHIFFNVLEHILNYCFDILVLFFSFAAYLGACYNRVNSLWWRHIILTIHVCGGVLGSRHLELCLRYFFLLIHILVLIGSVFCHFLDPRQVRWLYGFLIESTSSGLGVTKKWT